MVEHPKKMTASQLISQLQLSSIYHEQREYFLSKCHRIILFIIIMSSALLASGLFDSLEKTQAILVSGPAILASLDLVFNFSNSARTHKFLRHRFSDLESQLIGEKISESTFNDVLKKFTLLLADEPPVYFVLIDHCTNLLDIRTVGEKTIKIPYWKIFLMNIVRFGGRELNIISNDNV